MRVHRARWVLPMTGPVVRDGWVQVDDGLITRVGSGASPGAGASDTVRPEDGWTAILPGLVNAHTHLELSWMRGLVPPGPSMPEWASRLMALRATASPEPAARAAAIVSAVAEARTAGTALVGDIGNTDEAVAPIADSPLSARLFRELLGFRVAGEAAEVVARERAAVGTAADGRRIRTAVAPHAPFSVSPALLRAIGAGGGDAPISIHLAESGDELTFLRSGEGAWRRLLESVGAWRDDWRPPGTPPVDYLGELGLLTSRLLAVHGVQLDQPGLQQLAAAGATLVTCPRSNRWTGAGDPPIGAFYAAGVRMAIGTDSLASVDSLSVFDELAAARRLAPAVPAAALLYSATVEGARALGFDDVLGGIVAGRRAELIEVRIPPGTTDVEEYLLSGVGSGDLRWLASS